MIANSATDTHLIDSMPSSAGSRGMLAARQTGGSARHEHSTGLAEPALDLIEEHLTDINLESEYRSAIHAGKLLNNWNVHEDFKLDSSGHGVVLKVQSFDAGGAEFTCKLMNLEKIGNAIEFGGKTGKRDTPDQVSIDALIKSAQRSKVRVRKLVKNMGATNLVTLTRREGPATKGWSESQWAAWENGGRDRWEKEHGSFWNPDQWAAAWDKTRRNLERVLGKFPYVAVLERHRKGNHHIHLAWRGKVNLNLLRPIWALATGGKNSGNIDSQYIKTGNPFDKSSKIARYVSKYVSKQFENESGYRYNKKRYWASKQDLPEIRRYILKTMTLDGSFSELIDWVPFDFRDIFVFPDKSGWWFEYVPTGKGGDPPF